MLDFILNHTCNCQFDKLLTSGGMFFDVFVIIATVIFLFIFSRIKKNFLYHYFIVAIGVLIFEVFTSPLWINTHLGTFAYVYHDVSWILTIGWTTLILSVILLVDSIFKETSKLKKFFLYLLGMSFFGFLAESMVVFLGLRTYSQEVLDTLWGPGLWNVPIETFYYIPVFAALILGFYKYWANVIDDIEIVPSKNIKWGQSLGLSVVAVLLFELMIEPMVINTNLPSWSYIYNDISIIMTGIWIIIVWLSIKLVDKYFIHFDLVKRFVLYLVSISIIAIPLESWYISNGFRIYSESATRDFIGINMPIVNVPIEVVFAIPLYFALIIAFIKYGEFILTKSE